MAWAKELIMTEKRIRHREAEKRYRAKKRYLQSNKTPEQQESSRQSWRKYHNNNKDKRKAKGIKYYKENRDKCLEYAKQYHREHPEVNLKSGTKQLEKLGVNLGILTKDVKRVLMNWKRTIQKRDISCQVCGSKDNLQAHHILYRKYYPKLALNINNGMLLCRLITTKLMDGV